MSDYNYPPMSCCGGFSFHTSTCPTLLTEPPKTPPQRRTPKPSAEDLIDLVRGRAAAARSCLMQLEGNSFARMQLTEKALVLEEIARELKLYLRGVGE